MPFFSTRRPCANASLLALALSASQSLLAQTSSLTLPGEYTLELDATSSQWLSVGENTGIQVINSAGNSTSSWAQNAEFLDSRSIPTASGTQRIFASFDSSQSRVLLYSLDSEQQFQQDLVSSPIGFPVEGLCLHLDGAQRLHLFLLSELFEAHQYLLRPVPGEQWQMLPVRTLPTGPDSEYCAVDDYSATLFVSESSQTLWAYPTDPEAEVERTLIDAAAPFGNLGDGPLGLATAHGHLYALSGDGPTVHQYARQDGQFHYLSQHHHSLASANMQSAESLILSDTGEAQTLSLFDEKNRRFTVLKVPTPESIATPESLPEVMPVVETTPMPQRGDAADDPALWIHPTTPRQSLIVGTNKRQGLFVYDLEGNELQRLDTGRLNNVDIRYGVSWQGRMVDVAVASNRDLNTLSMFAIDRETRQLTLVAEIPTALQNIYGMCLYQDATQKLYAFANDEDGSFLQLALDTTSSTWTGSVVRRFSVATQPEGCVANDRTGQLFLGEEDVGIWTLSAAPDAPTNLQPVAKIGGALHDDIEGLALYEGENGTLLIASSQGNNSYVVLDSIAPYPVLATFRIGMNLEPGLMIDGASETDGLEVSSANLGGAYSAGLLIVQDGRNVLPEQAQNFKVVPWRDVQSLFPILRP